MCSQQSPFMPSMFSLQSWTSSPLHRHASPASIVAPDRDANQGESPNAYLDDLVPAAGNDHRVEDIWAEAHAGDPNKAG